MLEFLLALQFLTRVPVAIRSPVGERQLAWAMAYFPLVGLLLGSFTAAIYTLLSFVLAAPVCDLISLGFLSIITGNMHVDGLMDAADGLSSGKQREVVLAIMRDSRVGSHGAMAAVWCYWPSSYFWDRYHRWLKV